MGKQGPSQEPLRDPPTYLFPKGGDAHNFSTDGESLEGHPLRDYMTVTPLQLQAMAHNALNPTLPTTSKACYEWLYKAHCSKGQACPYSHDKTVAVSHLQAEEKKIAATRVRLGLNAITSPRRGTPGILLKYSSQEDSD